jgi:DNA-binding CsgD family transcriptional regulator
MVFFNDPLPCPDPAAQAVRLAMAIREKIRDLVVGWRKRGYELGFRAGIDLGFATLGTIGIDERADYGAIGSVVNLAARLCDEARDGQILVGQRVHAAVDDWVEATSVGMLTLKGFVRPVGVFSIERARASTVSSGPASPGPAPATPALDSSPLSEREHEVAALIAQGCSNREIARELLIAEATAVRHVANILAKLGVRSRAQVAVWAVGRGLGTSPQGQ